MSARITIDCPTPYQLRLVLRQDGSEVARFLLFVLAIAGALLLLMPQARQAPALLLGLVGVAGGWCAIALSARELYLFNSEARTVTVQRASLLGRSEQLLAIPDVRAVHQVVSGPDDNRRLLELVTERGDVQLRVPRRLNTLSAPDQDKVGRAIAGHLGVPLRSAPELPAWAGA